MRLSSLRVVALACVAACSVHDARVAPPKAEAHATQDSANEKERSDLFRALVAEVRAHHVFAEATKKNLGRAFEDDLPALEKEFVDAKTDDALVVALTHFGNALHDVHCTFETDGPTPAVALGIRADVEWRDGKPRFYVSRVDDANAKAIASPGDEIRSVDGVPAAEFISRFMLASHQNNVRSVAADVAEFLTRRRATHSLTREGDTSTWVVATRAHGDATLSLRWTKSESHDSFDEFAIDYERTWCSTLAARDYGPYELATRGMNFCIYASQVAPYKSFPIVRQFSFMYLTGDTEHAQHRVRADHDAMESALARLAPKGVIVDLRDNGGGNNPNWFMDWFASGPYVDRFVMTRLAADLDTPEKVA